ncbi:MAG: hypothetical protein J6866_08085, partial [Victivallales bacterium]|nr:hypothetical protein [Victivallales bacterium]
AIDFGPAKNLSDLSKVAATLMYQELLRGWKPVAGKINLAGLLPALEPAKLPVTEAIRLLLNRGRGLLMAGDKLSRGDGDQDFIVRNMHKSLLGSGDALLLAAGQYAWRSEERLEKFRELAAAYELPGEFVAGYREACQYKLEPTPYLPQNPWEFLRQCQRCWLRAVQITASAEDSSPEAVMEGLHRSARRHSSFRQFLRWTIRARAFRKPRFSCDQPVVTVLGMLYPTLLTAPPPAPPILPELFRLWQLFN